MPTERRRDAVRRPRRESERRIGREDASRNESDPVDAQEDRGPSRSPAGAERPARGNGEPNGQDTSDDEVRHLDPAEVADAEQADGMARQVEPFAGQYLERHDDQEQGSRDQASGEAKARLGPPKR
jgi:hypothetical protein